jgi:hypothetical protein
MTAAARGGINNSLWRGGTGFKTWLTSLTTATAAPTLSDVNTAGFEFVGPNSPNPGKSPWNKDLNNFAPHVGFAWQLPWFGKGKTTIRGGYSISYSPVGNSGTYETNTLNVPGTSYSYNYTGGTMNGLESTPAYIDMTNLASVLPMKAPANIQPLLPDPDNTRSDSLSVNDPNIRNPYVQSLNLSLTRNLGNNLTVDVRYIGTLSRKSISGININTPNLFSNGLFDAFQTARAVGDSLLLDALIPVGSLGPGVNGSDEVRQIPGFNTTYFMMNAALLQNGNYNTLANYLATTNGVLAGFASGTNGNVLRSGCLPNQYNATTGVCASHNVPENFIYTNPQYSSATINSNLGHSNYHSMQVQVNMRPVRGLSFQTTYTWSRNLTDQGLTDYRQGAARDYYLAGQHRTHALSSYGSYDMPFGANGFIFRNATGTFKKAIEGWQLTWIASMASGTPGSITGNNTLWGATNVNLVRPDLWDNKAGKISWKSGDAKGYYFGKKKYIYGPDPQCANVQTNSPFIMNWCNYPGLGLTALYDDLNHNGVVDSTDPVVFENALPGQKGNFGMNNLTSPGTWSLDLTMGKMIEFMEGKKIDFRLIADNVSNHATPGDSVSVNNPRWTTVGAPHYGLNTGAGTDFGEVNTKGNHRTFEARIRISF